MKRKDRFDHILIETTGLADPGPVAQTFFVDDEMQSQLQLDGVVTVVDARHIWEHIDSSDEAKEQIAFADVILLNKIDLVPPETVDRLEARIRSMNAAARIHRTQDAAVAIDQITDIGGFDLNRALEVDPQFMEAEYPFEWGGMYLLDEGSYELVFQDGSDPTIDVVWLPLEAATPSALEAAQMSAALAFSEREDAGKRRGALRPGSGLARLRIGPGETRYAVQISRPGAYAPFTQHHPDEYWAELCDATGVVAPVVAREYKPDHEHDASVTSVGITTPGDLNNPAAEMRHRSRASAALPCRALAE